MRRVDTVTADNSKTPNIAPPIASKDILMRDAEL